MFDHFDPSRWGTVATILGVFVGASSLVFSAITASRTFSNRRREFAATLAYNFAKDEDWLTALALELARSKQPFVRDIINKSATSIPAKFYESVCTILRSRQSEDALPDRPKGALSTFRITSTQSEMIKFIWVNWLNQLEGVLASWEHKAADRKIMEAVWEASMRNEAFNALTTLTEQSNVIDNFRKAMEKTIRRKEQSKIRREEYRKAFQNLLTQRRVVNVNGTTLKNCPQSPSRPAQAEQ